MIGQDTSIKMGIKSPSKSLNQYQAANESSKDITNARSEYPEISNTFQHLMQDLHV